MGLKHSYTIRLLASISPDVFPLSTLYPTKSNLRIQSYDSATDSVESKPTPIYNTSILLDSSHKTQLLYLHRLHKICPSFRSALALWRIWGDRRGLSTRSGGGSVGWSWLGTLVLGFIVDGGEVAVSVKGETTVRARKGLGRGLSEWQLLRAGWELLCESRCLQMYPRPNHQG